MTDTNNGKIITLPLTCKQILWIIIPMFHIFVIGGHIWAFIDFDNRWWAIPITVGWTGVIVFWVFRFVFWDFEGKLPSFRCKCEAPNSSEEM